MEQIIECPNCGQKNRINNENISEAKCAKCWKIIYKNPKELEKEKEGSSSNSYGWIFWLLAIVGFVIFLNSQDNSSAKKETYKKQAFSQPEQITPYNGEIRSFTNLERVAPLEIQTSTGSNYVLKLKDAYTKESIMTIFVRGGSDIEIKVPLGSYEITYASGDKWYGYDYLFGSDTGYSKADEVFSFRNTGYQITGYTITLYSVSNGNLRTQNINKAQF